LEKGTYLFWAILKVTTFLKSNNPKIVFIVIE
jgi:hypothetical protein